MSDQTATAGSDTESESRLAESLADFGDWYHWPALGILLGFMLWVRVRSYERFVTESGVLLSGNDAYYHLRMVRYTVRNFPNTMPFDPWTYFPYGTAVGQFGTLFDQLVATAALVVGLGSPSPELVSKVVLVAPAVFGTLVAIPTYFIGRRLGGRAAGVFGVAVLALLPGQFLTRSLVGFADHNIAEPLFQSLAVLGSMVAVAAAERDKPVLEQVAGRDVAGLRSVVGWSVAAGAALAAYIWLWPPGILLIGVLGVFYAVKLCLDYVRGVSPDHVGIVAGVSMLTAGFLALMPLTTVSFNPVQYSIIQPFAAFAVGVGALFMAWLAREWDSRDLDANLYPLTILGIGVVGLAVIYVVLPDLFNTLRTNVVRFVGFSAGAQFRTIQEAQPMAMTFDAVYGSYGFAFFSALFGAFVVLADLVTGGRERGEYLLVVVWFAFIAAAAFTQIRFNYYLAVPVAVLNAFLLGWLLNLDFFGSIDALEDLQASHVFVVLTVLLLVLAPLAVGVSSPGQGDSTQSVASIGNSTGPSGSFMAWDSSLEWMQNSTPEEGNYAGAGNGDELEFYGTYARTDDFDYPAGYYGVMSWWDYGHWITTQAHRIPNANPFQEGATSAANFLLAPTEQRSLELLDQYDEPDAKTRYVMVDWQMALPGYKFSAPTVFYDDAANVGANDFRSYYGTIDDQGRIGQANFTWLKTQRYYDSLMVRLYRFHGSAVSPQPLVVDWDRQTTLDTGLEVSLINQAGQQLRRFENMNAAREFVAEDGTSQIGGTRGVPSEYVPALNHYRLVHANQQRAFRLALRGRLSLSKASRVKTFERVPGATVRGSAPANTNVSMTIQLQTNTGAFNYTQRAQTGSDGTFTMTVPYSTTGYDQWGTQEGYTNVSTRATGPAEFEVTAGGTTYTATAHVPEGAVVGATNETVSVELSEGSGNGTNASRLTAPPAPSSLPGTGDGPAAARGGLGATTPASSAPTAAGTPRPAVALADARAAVARGA